MIKRALFRIQPIEHIRKRQQRKKEMWERHEKFAEYVERVKKNRRADNGKSVLETIHTIQR